MEKVKGTRGSYRMFGPATWDAIRTGWAKGMTATALEQRFGPSRYTIYHRARKEGWGKRAAAAAETAGPATEAPASAMAVCSDRPSVEAAVRMAAEKAVEAMIAGRAAEARDFGRLAEHLNRVARAGVAPEGGAAVGGFVAGFTPARDLDLLLGERFDLGPEDGR